MLSITRPSLPSQSSPPSPCHVFVGERLQFSLQLSAASLAAHGWRVDQLVPSCFSADLVASPLHDVAHAANGGASSGSDQSQQRCADDVPLLRRRSSIEPEDESILSPLPSNRAAHVPRMSALPDGGVCVHFEMQLDAHGRHHNRAARLLVRINGPKDDRTESLFALRHMSPFDIDDLHEQTVRGFVAFNRSHSIQDGVFFAQLPVWLHQPLLVSYRSHSCGGSSACTFLSLRIENTSADACVSLMGAALDQNAPLNTHSNASVPPHARHDSTADSAADAADGNAWHHAVAPIVPTRDLVSNENSSGDQRHRTLGSEFSAHLLEADLPQLLAPGEVFHLAVALEPRHAMAATAHDASLSSSQSSAADIDDLLGKPSARWLSTRRVFPPSLADDDNIERHHTPISLSWQLCDQDGHMRANPIAMTVGVTWRSNPRSNLVVSFLPVESPAPVGRPFLATVAVRIPVDTNAASQSALSEHALPSRYLLVDASTNASRVALARYVAQHTAASSPPPPLSEHCAAEARADMQADKSDFSEGNGEFARQRAVELECKAVLLALNERQDEGQADSRGLTVLHSWLDLGILNAGQTATATLELRAARAGIHCLAHLFVVRISVGADAEPAPCGRRGLEVFAASDLIEVQCD